jgi:hypothetical protein
MGGFFEKDFYLGITKRVEPHLPYEDVKRLLKIPATSALRWPGARHCFLKYNAVSITRS